MDSIFVQFCAHTVELGLSIWSICAFPGLHYICILHNFLWLMKTCFSYSVATARWPNSPFRVRHSWTICPPLPMDGSSQASLFLSIIPETLRQLWCSFDVHLMFIISVILLDLSVAFDTTSHSILLSQLLHHKPIRLILIISISNAKTMTQGVPQGSVFDLLPFILQACDTWGRRGRLQSVSYL